MAKINLRPWRAELRKQKQNEYLAVLGLVFAAAIVVWWLVAGFYQASIDSQLARNNYLEIQSKAMDAKIEQIQKLREQREQLLERMKLIQDLQGNRPVIVRVFDEMTRVMPEEAYLEKIVVKGNQFSISGRASSNEQISQLMRNMDASDWFDEPNLIGMKANKGGYNDFEMTVLQKISESVEVK